MGIFADRITPLRGLGGRVGMRAPATHPQKTRPQKTRTKKGPSDDPFFFANGLLVLAGSFSLPIGLADGGNLGQNVTGVNIFGAVAGKKAAPVGAAV